MLLSLKSVEEPKPGKKWLALFEKSWPYYKKWYTQEGLLRRPGYLTASEKLKEYMPELWPLYQELTTISGGQDLQSRFLTLYNPPPFMSGCTQLAWTKPPYGLIRNYEYDPRFFEGVLLKTNWLKPVIGISDCNWGLLDGINGDGLVVSLTFGGRKITGIGFGIPLIIRYVLETCSTALEARMAFAKIPVHMAYNVTMVDKMGNYFTLFLSPDRPPVQADSWVATNHQEIIEWTEYAALTGTIERKQYLDEILLNPYLNKEDVIKRFFSLPLYHNTSNKSFVTLYTSIYNILEKSITVRWPNKEIKQSFVQFEEGREILNLTQYQSRELIK